MSYLSGLNSGGFIGYLDNIIDMLSATNDIPPDLLANWPGGDQGLYSNLYLSRRYPITLDYWSRIFLAWGFVGDPSEQGLQGGLDSRSILAPRVEGDAWGPRMNSRTRTIPAVLHFNADGKSVMNDIIPQLTYYHNWQEQTRKCQHFHVVIRIV